MRDERDEGGDRYYIVRPRLSSRENGILRDLGGRQFVSRRIIFGRE